MAVLLAGLPTSVPGATVNRLCGSGLDAAMQARRAIETGDADVVLVGGVESMSRAPWVLLKPEQGLPGRPRDAALDDARLAHGQPRRCRRSGRSRSARAPRSSPAIYGIGREAQDAFALRSHQRGRRLGRRLLRRLGRPGRRASSSTRDEGIRADSSTGEAGQAQAGVRRRTARSPPATRRRSTTAPRRCLVGDEAAPRRGPRAARPDRRPRHARGVDPDVFGIGPVEAANRALARAGITLGRRRRRRAQRGVRRRSRSPAWARGRSSTPRSVNVNGGAIAIGHPLGASGARILGTLAHELQRRGGGWGVAAICIGVGQGLAVVLETA